MAEKPEPDHFLLSNSLYVISNLLNSLCILSYVRICLSALTVKTEFKDTDMHFVIISTYFYKWLIGKQKVNNVDTC